MCASTLAGAPARTLHETLLKVGRRAGRGRLAPPAEEDDAHGDDHQAHAEADDRRLLLLSDQNRILFKKDQAQDRVGEHQEGAVDGEEDRLRVEAEAVVQALLLQDRRAGHAQQQRAEHLQARGPCHKKLAQDLHADVGDAANARSQPRGQQQVLQVRGLEEQSRLFLDVRPPETLPGGARRERGREGRQQRKGERPGGEALERWEARHVHQVLVRAHAGGQDHAHEDQGRGWEVGPSVEPLAQELRR
mmetsp:Transcript_770/g.2456  ORF Transcript_770/g.2456 Transcript_770/m.2456 type:complete len:248 (-) Transcript_770:257-1000(-)